MKTTTEAAALGRFGTGLKRPITAMARLSRDPKSWPLALMPMLIFTILAGCALWFGPDVADWLLDWIWQEPRGSDFWTRWVLHPLWSLCWFVCLLLGALLGVVVGFLLSIPLAGPFLEMLCERQEDPEDAVDHRFSWRRALSDSVRSVGHLSLFLLLELGLILLCLALGWIPVLGPPIAAIGSASGTLFVLGIGLLDYPMTLRVWRFSEKIRFARQTRGEFLGFALCGFVLLYVPVLNLLTLPACVLGANAMILDWEAHGRIDWTDRRRS